MKAHIRLVVAFLAASTLVLPAVAQTLRASSGNGSLVAPGTTAPRIQLTVRNGAGVARPGITVTFEQECVARLRGDPPPYACVSAVEPLQVVSDANGVVNSPLYQADLIPGNAWVNVSAQVDGVDVRTLVYWRVGSSAPSVITGASGSGQTLQINFPIDQPLRARVVDDRGQPIVGVPVTFNSNCGSPLACLAPAATGARLVSDAGGHVSSGIRNANGVPGTYTVSFAIEGGPTLVAFTLTNARPTRFATLQMPVFGQYYLEFLDAPATCAIETMERMDENLLSPPPSLVAAPRGRVRLVIENCPVGAEVKLSLQHADGMPEGARVWSARPTWRPLASTNPVEGFWEFPLKDGGPDDPDGTADGRIEIILAVAFGDPTVQPNFQDLWWVGAPENGWGVSIVQHGLSLFIVVFGYDAAGLPTWYVMPGGAWNATAGFTGNLYSPRGRPIATHTAANLVVGAPAGSATLEFSDVMNARLILRIGGTETVKFIKRQIFGAREERTVPAGDMWWAGAARSGWGLVLHKQRASLFGLVFGYRTDGAPTWWALPGGIWTATDMYEGVVYQTRNASGWPATYAGSQLVTQTTGSFKLRFVNGNAVFDFTGDGAPSQFTLMRQPF